MQLDPELAVLTKFPRLDYNDIPGMRALVTQMLAVAEAPSVPADLSIADHHIPGPAGAPNVPVRVYRPKAHADLPVLVYFHGGAFVLGDLESEHGRLMHLAHSVHCAVVSVDYRLAPEHRFPAGAEDCYAALLWAAGHDHQLGFDKTRIAVGGSSAGGALAAAVAQMARDRKGPAVAFQFLVYPVLDNTVQTWSARNFPDVPMFTSGNIQDMWRLYLPEGADPASPTVSPYAAPARAKDLAGLPPAYIVTGALDPLRDEDIAYATRLLQAGVPTELHVYPNAPHAFDMVPEAHVAQHAVAEYYAVLRRAFG